MIDRLKSCLMKPTVSGAALVLILAVAALLRFQNVHAIEHNVDQAYPIWQALMTIDRGVFPVVGQGTSVLFANPALTGYLFVPFVALTRSPLGPVLFAILLNTLAVWFAYRAASLLLDPHRALIAALLMAVNPWLVEYSRTTWVQALIPFFACLVFWLLVPILLGTAARPGWRVLLAALALTAMTQTYLLGFAVLIPVGFLLLTFRQRIPWRSIALGGALVGAATAIYTAGLLANREETATKLRDFATGPSRLSAEAWSHAVRLVSGQNYAVARGMDAPAGDWVTRENLSEVVHAVILVAVLAGIFGSVAAIVRRGADSDRALIALAWFGLPVLLMTYVSRPVHPFYLLLTLPAGYILAAQGAGYLLRWRVSAFGLVAVSIPVTVLLGINVLRFAEETLARPGAHDMSALPLGTGIEMMRNLVPPEMRGPGAVIFADVDEWILNSLAGHLFPVDRDINASRILYAPSGGATYLRFGAGKLGAPPEWATQQGFVYLVDGSFVVCYRVLPEEIRLRIGTTPPIRGDKGIDYLGWEAENPIQPGATATLITYWEINTLRPERGGWLFGPFVHVFDDAGKRIAIGSGAVVAGERWRQGDIHIQRITVSIPADAAGPFTFQFGQYDGVHNLNVIFSLPEGPSVAIPIKP